jgi:MarR family
MPAKRELSMRRLRHLLRLPHGGVSAREIGRRLGVARSTVQDNLKRAAAAGLAWPLADDVTDDALELRLLGRAGVETGQRRRIEPDPRTLKSRERIGQSRFIHAMGRGHGRNQSRHRSHLSLRFGWSKTLAASRCFESLEYQGARDNRPDQTKAALTGLLPRRMLSSQFLTQFPLRAPDA